MLGSAEYVAFEELRDLRNKATHDLDDSSAVVDVSQAVKYVLLANRMIASAFAGASTTRSPLRDRISRSSDRERADVRLQPAHAGAA